MVKIGLLNGEIEILSDEISYDEDTLLRELNRVLCFTITIYKRRIEKLQQSKLSELDEAIINQKIKDAIVMLPVDEVRAFIVESNN